MTNESGYIVETKDEKKGRTFHNKGFINRKQPVYLATEFKDTVLPDGKIITTPEKFSASAILCEPGSLKIIGFIK